MKGATVLRPGGRLALLSNRITPVSPTRQHLDEAHAGYLDVSQRPAIDAVHDGGLIAMLEECGFTTEQRRVIERLHYATDDWVNMVLTYSNTLTLGQEARVGLRSRLQQRIGAAGVKAQNDAAAVICTAHQ